MTVFSKVFNVNVRGASKLLTNMNIIKPVEWQLQSVWNIKCASLHEVGLCYELIL